MKTYKERQEEIRNEAIEWQHSFTEQDYSWGEIITWGNYFEKLGKRFGLLREFRENGIC